MSSKYITEFLQLRCAPDVLGVVNPLGDKATKEISESMACIKRLKSIALSDPMRYRIIDLCAGNALTSVLAAHMLPVRSAIAIDKRPRNRDWHKVKRFDYWTEDLRTWDFLSEITSDDILLAVHPCKMADDIAIIYRNSLASHLVMMPCCEGHFPQKKQHQFLRSKMSKYEMWCLHLAERVNGLMVADTECLSPKNIIIRAKKG